MGSYERHSPLYLCVYVCFYSSYDKIQMCFFFKYTYMNQKDNVMTCLKLSRVIFLVFYFPLTKHIEYMRATLLILSICVSHL